MHFQIHLLIGLNYNYFEISWFLAAMEMGRIVLAGELPSHRISVLLWVRPPDLLHPEDIPGSRLWTCFGTFPPLAVMSQFSFGNPFHFCKGDHEMKVVRDGEVPGGTETSPVSNVFIHHKAQSCGEPSSSKSPCLGAAGVCKYLQTTDLFPSQKKRGC